MSSQIKRDLTTLRKDLPDLPERMKSLPLHKGYPVPFFVQKFDIGYDFRVVDADKLQACVHYKLCWICGQKLGSAWAFTLGPMCIINRINSEPPSHRECAEFAVKACPFLNQQQVKRNVSNLPDEIKDAAGVGIDRQPGVIAIWLTSSYKIIPAPGGSGFLFEIGPASQVLWFREGRTATRAECLESIESGFPVLEEMEEPGTIGMFELLERRSEALKYLPEDGKKFTFGSAARR